MKEHEKHNRPMGYISPYASLYKGSPITCVDSDKVGSNIDRCKSIFVSWAWLASIILVLAGSIVGISFSYSADMTKTKSRLSEVEKGIDAVKRIESKIDTLINRVR